MANDCDFSRRELLRLLAATGVGALLPLPLSSRCDSFGATARPGGSPTAVVFDPREWRIIEAAAECILPGGADPGATDANVVRFIDRQLAEPHFGIFRKEFEAGVGALDLVSAARFGAPFLEVPSDARTAVLRALEAGEGSTAGFSSAHFFIVLLTLTLEGFLADPIYGGNAGQIGWQLVGIEPPHPQNGGGRHG